MFTTKKPPIDLELPNQIAGWMTYKELRWLAKQAQDHYRIVEIGSYFGRSTRAIGQHTPGVLYAIDDFVGPRDMSLPGPLRNDILEGFMYNMRDLLEIGKTVVTVADHTEVNVPFSPDMVFIDGSHLYQDVHRDIRTWMPRMAPGGLICGHDYTNIASVREAVDELVPGAKVAPNTTIWYHKLNK